jgi:hypothetical protein
VAILAVKAPCLPAALHSRGPRFDIAWPATLEVRGSCLPSIGRSQVRSWWPAILVVKAQFMICIREVPCAILKGGYPGSESVKSALHSGGPRFDPVGRLSWQ